MNLKKISPSGDAEFYCLSGEFIKFYVYVKEKKKSPPQMRHIEGNFGRKTSKITKNIPWKLSPLICMSGIICIKFLPHLQHIKIGLMNSLGFLKCRWREILSIEETPVMYELKEVVWMTCFYKAQIFASFWTHGRWCFWHFHAWNDDSIYNYRLEKLKKWL